jgi:hypothetical protein
MGGLVTPLISPGCAVTGPQKSSPQAARIVHENILKHVADRVQKVTGYGFCNALIHPVALDPTSIQHDQGEMDTLITVIWLMANSE